MKLYNLFSLSLFTLAIQAHAQEATDANEIKQADAEVEHLLISGVRQDRISEGATGLTMEISETPQSISVITSDLMKNFAAFSINDALRLATGVTVEAWETNRTNYSSRGFEIKNTQIDGVGLPNDWGIVTGAIDAYGYESIEVIRGANGLLTGVGNASGTINYVRKRPTNETGGEVSVIAGSYDFKRIQADYNTLLTDDGRWAARFVVAGEDTNSHLDGLSDDLGYFYGVVDGQLTDHSTLTVGISHQDANTDGNLWGGLVFNYTDGTQAQWDDSDTTSQDWAMWDTQNTNAFVEFTHQINDSWRLDVNYHKRYFEEQDKLFYASGTLDKETNLGLLGYPGRYDSDIDSDLLEVKTSGFFSAFGFEHEATFGISYAQSTDTMFNYATDFTEEAWGALPAFPYALNAIAEPDWQERTLYSEIKQNLTRIFGSTKITLSDNLFMIAGVNAIDFERSGDNSGTTIDNSESELSPYVGFTYAITQDINAYASYSDIYQPQEQYDLSGQYLDPTKGKNTEAGIKVQWLDDSLLTTFAYFTAEQENLASYAGINPDNGQYYYNGIDVDSKGFEIEMTGQLTDDLSVILGYTAIEIEDDQGADANTWAPRDYVNFSLNYTVPALPTLTVGLSGRWQSETKNTDYNVTQDSYFLLNAYASYDITNDLSVKANLNNITDEKYLSSLHSSFYYAAPINGTVSVTYRF
ncbi:iron complex outermembrane recepter protein [Paraglaciecola mesophila KMM 241]|uniref:Iron complex outermembrane recepter protein n=1 Tax=Paraglaciecola mesophila KMM 241 TaxID=1128912 RepID=K6YY04_9ALTE|nr:TonB-dependent siderophore receptor [Paraglaciecola mesophila]GAC23057.1 iron complex outermembrane recepter protein [Paraglaciecola mesophila KMM 241]